MVSLKLAHVTKVFDFIPNSKSPKTTKLDSVFFMTSCLMQVYAVLQSYQVCLLEGL